MANKKNLAIVIEAKDQTKKGIKSAETGMKSLGTQALKLGALFGGGLGVLSLGRKMIDLAGNFEQTQIAFTTMLGSAGEANRLLKDLADFAAATPFELTGIEKTAKQLLAYGVAANDMIPTLKALGDVSAGLSVPIGQVAYAYGQVKVATRLMGQELLQFTNAGVPLIAELAKNLDVAEGSIKKMVSQGKIGFADVEKAFQTMSGESGKFADLMDKQSKTFLGKVSNLQDGIDIFLRTQGNMFIVWGSAMVDKLIVISDWLANDAAGMNYLGKTMFTLTQFFKLLFKTLQAVINIFVAFAMTMFDASKVVIAFVRDGIKAFKNFGKNLSQIFTAIGKAMIGDFSGAKDEIKKMFADTFSNVSTGMRKFSVSAKANAKFVGDSWVEVGRAFKSFVKMEGLPNAEVELGEYTKTVTGVGEKLTEASKEGKKTAEAFSSFGESLQKFSKESLGALDDVGKKIMEITKDLEELTVGHSKDTLGIKQQYAEAYVNQEKKVAALQKQIGQETDAFKKQTLREELDREIKVLNDKKTIELAYHNEVA